MNRGRRLVCCLLALVTGCEREPAAPEAPAGSEPVVVFAAYEDRDYLPLTFRTFTEKTGVPVIVRHGDAERLVADVIEHRITPPADILWLRDATRLHYAAEEGALRPLPAGTVPEQVPPGLRDPDDFWTAVSFDVAVIAWQAGTADPGDAAGYARLASPSFAGRLCLPSSAGPASRAVLATLIRELGTSRSEAVVRRWMARLAEPVYAEESRLLVALDQGDCDVTFVLAGSVARSGARVEVAVPGSAAVVAEGAGVARHARNPEGAARLIGWMSRPGVQAKHAAAMGAFPANTAAALPAGLVSAAAAAGRAANISQLAFEAEAARLLAERTGYRE